MLELKLKNEEYLIDKEKIVYVNGYQFSGFNGNGYTIKICFSNCEDCILINCHDYEEYLYILKKIKDTISF